MSGYTRQDLTVMQGWPLERKIRVTQAKIIEWYYHYDGRVAVSFSGGKDSTVLLDLARRAFPDIRAAYVDTGLEYPEIRAFVKTVPNVAWLHPDMAFPKVIQEYGYPVISKEVPGASTTPAGAACGPSSSYRAETGTAHRPNSHSGMSSGRILWMRPSPFPTSAAM